MPRTPKATDGDAPKKSVRKTATTEVEGSTKVTKTTKTAKIAKPKAIKTSAQAVEVPVTPIRESAPATQIPLEERVRLRAYELYLRRGGRGGSPEQDWFQAISEIYTESVA